MKTVQYVSCSPGMQKVGVKIVPTFKTVASPMPIKQRRSYCYDTVSWRDSIVLPVLKTGKDPNNNKGYTVGVFIDFQSAFDMMWRSGLLIKLKNLGITGNIHSFVKIS